jgi:cell division septum initiation protein DivIVA
MQQFQDDIMKIRELSLENHRKLSQRIDELEKRMSELENMLKN